MTMDLACLYSYIFSTDVPVAEYTCIAYAVALAQLSSLFCFVSAKFGPLMIFLKRWFAYNKIVQGDSLSHPFSTKHIPQQQALVKVKRAVLFFRQEVIHHPDFWRSLD